MLSLLALVSTACAVFVLSLTAASNAVDVQRPTYATAHRVLRPEAVTAAIPHGANALEIDLTAWYFGCAGATARDIFEFIAQNGYSISFVWLDIKNPDYCRKDRPRSIEALRDLARQILEPVGIQVLYGFSGAASSRSYKVGAEDTRSVLGWYDTTNAAIAAKQRIMDFGNLRLNQRVDLYPELRCGSWERDRGKLGTVLSWTSGEGDTEILRYLLGAAAIDGLVYGYSDSEYNDESGAKSALQDIIDFVACDPDTHRMATRYDLPW
ncbi:uncharacterized protein BDW43DRAFT_299841 [Aspergillus alliaceus]|uniref:uncharacterized protein n=1 Tax=Petromyces alliaceus TaxID=209559 RepID=UPI0012A59351|nr:uncharacterized protein BDW43DRAFT_299841 [Aspergillus alliaceus]KAB8234179.1 hypothetical protein BDW43DRAFT_299841 [Aspergillus alliaceus]